MVRWTPFVFAVFALEIVPNLENDGKIFQIKTDTLNYMDSSKFIEFYQYSTSFIDWRMWNSPIKIKEFCANYVSDHDAEILYNEWIKWIIIYNAI